MPQQTLIAIATALVIVAGPLLLGAAGWMRTRGEPARAMPTAQVDWALVGLSALLYTLAFNLTFFIQELFLVLPKALTPGLQPTLFHNNHTWRGEHPLASLFQGTGALATCLGAAACALLLWNRTRRPLAVRLFLVWMAYCGFFMALPQVVIGALSPASDLGMAMDYFRLGPTAKTAAALVALAAIPPIAFGLARTLLGCADDPACIGDAAARRRFTWRMATLPALIALALIVPFRVPRDWIEVAVVPVFVAVAGIPSMQAGACWIEGVAAQGGPRPASILRPLAVVLLLLAVFHLVLRPGIRFY